MFVSSRIKCRTTRQCRQEEKRVWRKICCLSLILSLEYLWRRPVESYCTRFGRVRRFFCIPPMLFTDACGTKSKKQVSFRIYAGIFLPVAYIPKREKEPDICLSLHEILEKQLHHRCIFDFLFSSQNPFSWLLLTGIYGIMSLVQTAWHGVVDPCSCYLFCQWQELLIST